jgi:hypothetical protein
VRLEGLGKLKNIHLIGTRSHDLRACSIVPQPPMLPCAPMPFSIECKILQTGLVSFFLVYHSGLLYMNFKFLKEGKQENNSCG